MLGLDKAQGFWLIDEVLPEITGFLSEVNDEEEAPAAELDSKTVDKIEAIVEQTMSENRVPGFAIGVIKAGGELVYADVFRRYQPGRWRSSHAADTLSTS